MAKSVTPHLTFILETLESIRANTPSNKAMFLADPNAQDATLMRLQDIGEQLTRIRDQFPEFFESNADDSWYKLIGLRNIISHGYREIDFEIIWEIIATQLADFERHIHEIETR